MLRNCHDPVYQGYHSAMEKCVNTGGSLPYTGASLIWFILIALGLLTLGVVLCRAGR